MTLVFRNLRVIYSTRKSFTLQRWRSVIIPREKGILFSVCLSVCPGRFFSHFVRVTPPIIFITHKPNLYHLKAGCLECVMGIRFSVPHKISAK